MITVYAVIFFFLAFMQYINCFWLAKNSLILERHGHIEKGKIARVVIIS